MLGETTKGETIKDMKVGEVIDGRNSYEKSLTVSLTAWCEDSDDESEYSDDADRLDNWDFKTDFANRLYTDRLYNQDFNQDLHRLYNQDDHAEHLHNALQRQQRGGLARGRHGLRARACRRWHHPVPRWRARAQLQQGKSVPVRAIRCRVPRPRPALLEGIIRAWLPDKHGERGARCCSSWCSRCGPSACRWTSSARACPFGPCDRPGPWPPRRGARASRSTTGKRTCCAI